MRRPCARQGCPEIVEGTYCFLADMSDEAYGESFSAAGAVILILAYSAYAIWVGRKAGD